MTKELDSKDWKILYHLCQDSRLSHNRIGKLVSLSKNSVTYRIERLIKKGIIKGFFTIVNYPKLGIDSTNMLIRIHANQEREKQFIEYLKANPNTIVVDRLLGEWDFLIEFGWKRVDDFYSFISEIKANFSDIIDVYEIHTPLQTYRVEQLPVELVEERLPKPMPSPQTVKIDDTDLKLLVELNKNSTASLFELGGKLNLTYETVSARIKKLKEGGVIRKFTAKIGLAALGYDVYLILLEHRNFSKEREQALKGYLNAQKNIRYAFLSASKPITFVYLATKTSNDLDTFLGPIKEKFSDIAVNQKYLLSTEQLKYELFPDGLIK